MLVYDLKIQFKFNLLVAGRDLIRRVLPNYYYQMHWSIRQLIMINILELYV